MKQWQLVCATGLVVSSFVRWADPEADAMGHTHGVRTITIAVASKRLGLFIEKME